MRVTSAKLIKARDPKSLGVAEFRYASPDPVEPPADQDEVVQNAVQDEAIQNTHQDADAQNADQDEARQNADHDPVMQRGNQELARHREPRMRKALKYVAIGIVGAICCRGAAALTRRI